MSLDITIHRHLHPITFCSEWHLPLLIREWSNDIQCTFTVQEKVKLLWCGLKAAINLDHLLLVIESNCFHLLGGEIGYAWERTCRYTFRQSSICNISSFKYHTIYFISMIINIRPDHSCFSVNVSCSGNIYVNW